MKVATLVARCAETDLADSSIRIGVEIFGYINIVFRQVWLCKNLSAASSLFIPEFPILRLFLRFASRAYLLDYAPEVHSRYLL